MAHSYCSGGYKVGYIGGSNSNNYLEWSNVYSKEGGDYKLTIGYICGENRTINVYVNGKKAKGLSCNSGGWEKVGKKTLDITLEKGENTIRLVNTSGWLPDMDYIDVTPAIPTSVGMIKDEANKPQRLYNLQGREVKGAQAHGIVVSNNRKMIRK